MSEETSPAVMKIDADEDFLDHVERGQRKLKNLSLTTLVVAVLLGAAYFSQILTPFLTGQKVVEVNLTDPSLLVVEVLILGLTLAWMYVAALNYLFYNRLGRQVKEIRAKEAELLRRIEGP